MTEALFRDDAYLKDCEATVTAIDDGTVLLDRTVFYPMGGGQPGDTGRLSWDGGSAAIVDTSYGSGGAIRHVLAEGDARPPAGASVLDECPDQIVRFVPGAPDLHDAERPRELGHLARHQTAAACGSAAPSPVSLCARGTFSNTTRRMEEFALSCFCHRVWRWGRLRLDLDLLQCLHPDWMAMMRIQVEQAHRAAISGQINVGQSGPQRM